ncbi:MAG: leucyl aminopeptidase [Neisseriales bacterium]|nr:MAG: leucyl aminopeptidase [Neisseriales bacterium]
MEFAIKSSSSASIAKNWVIVGVYEDGTMPLRTQELDNLSSHVISDAIQAKELRGKTAAYLIFPCRKIIGIGLGAKDRINLSSYRKILKSAAQALKKTQATHVINYLTELSVKDCKIGHQIAEAISLFEDQYYQFRQFKTQQNEHNFPLRKVTLVVPTQAIQEARMGLINGQAIAQGVTLTKNLANLPSNICTPDYLANQACQLAKKTKIKVKVLKEKELIKLNMNALLAVAKGSVESPRLIVLNYQYATSKKTKPIVLVGKGITFDSGGISLKPALNMENMKFDMCGAASVLGTFQAVATMKLPINLIGLIPTCENLPSGHACKPGDIIKTMSGMTVEIFNTDAEGRLILCDALHYAKQFNPQYVVDIATLTGACLMTFGHIASALFANCDDLIKKIVDASEQSGDRTWPMPLWEDYDQQIKGRLADLVNIGGPTAGSITAAKFLSHFTKAYHWAHLDIAGIAYTKDKYATGRPVPLLVQFLQQYALEL